jgi:Leucine-rich repeat (LRR) protein
MISLKEIVFFTNLNGSSTLNILNGSNGTVTYEKWGTEYVSKSTSKTISLTNDGTIRKLKLKYDNNSLITSISGNFCKVTLPSSIGDLIALSTLELPNSSITSIPTTIGNCKSLTNLNLNSNVITVIPNELSNCTLLTSVQISGNSLSGSIPVGIVNVININTFTLTFNSYSSSDLNNFIDNMYSTRVLRSIHTSIQLHGNGSISGTYQMPSGFSYGISDGTPSNQLEKVWVMTNQVIDGGSMGGTLKYKRSISYS